MYLAHNLLIQFSYRKVWAVSRGKNKDEKNNGLLEDGSGHHKPNILRQCECTHLV